MLYFHNAQSRVLSDYKLPAATRRLLEKSLEQLNVPLLINCWDAAEISIKGKLTAAVIGQSVLRIRIDHPGVIRLLVQGRDPLQLLEAYLNGYLHFDAPVDCIAKFADRVYAARPTRLDYLQGWLGSFFLPQLQLESVQRRWHDLPPGSKERDREAVRYHYDVGNDFYQLWLDRGLVYSCAFFSDSEMNLNQAQEAKLDLICRKLDLQPGERLLDIGCGWGALLRWAVKNYGVIGHGITLSDEQYQFNQKRIVQEKLQDKMTVEILDYRDLPAKLCFDKVVSIEMIEQVGIRNYPLYFNNVRRCMKPGGTFLCQAITTFKERPHKDLAERFIADYVFPDGELASFPKLTEAAENSGWKVADAESWRPHYAKTLRAWVDNLESVHETAERLVGLRHTRLWTLYMIGCALAYEASRLDVYQLLLKQADNS